MQVLVFHLGKDRYGLPTRHLKRVLPLMELKQLPKAPDYVAGLMNFHGDPVPVIDLSMLACGMPCTPHFDTRILLVDYRAPDGEWHELGLAAEGVTGIEHIDAAMLSEPGVATEEAPYLGKVSTRGGNILQLVEIDRLVADNARAILFPHHVEEAS